jgi:hypothetical protein
VRLWERQELGLLPTTSTTKSLKYTSLGKDTQKLESDLDSCIITFTYAVAHSKGKQFDTNVERAIDVLTNQMISINRSLTSPQIEEPIHNLILRLLNDLGPGLRDVQNDRRRLPSLIEAYNQSLKQQLTNINKQIEDKRKLLAIER